MLMSIWGLRTFRQTFIFRLKIRFEYIPWFVFIYQMATSFYLAKSRWEPQHFDKNKSFMLCSINKKIRFK